MCTASGQRSAKHCLANLHAHLHWPLAPFHHIRQRHLLVVFQLASPPSQSGLCLPPAITTPTALTTHPRYLHCPHCPHCLQIDFWNRRWHGMFKWYFVQLVYRPVQSLIHATGKPSPLVKVGHASNLTL